MVTAWDARWCGTHPGRSHRCVAVATHPMTTLSSNNSGISLVPKVSWPWEAAPTGAAFVAGPGQSLLGGSGVLEFFLPRRLTSSPKQGPSVVATRVRSLPRLSGASALSMEVGSL